MTNLDITAGSFHRADNAAGSAVAFTEPLVRPIQDGVADGTLRRVDDYQTVGTVLFNGICWPYVHLGGSHQWSASQARDLLVRLLTDGLQSERREHIA
jgi:hypothetical protein